MENYKFINLGPVFNMAKYDIWKGYKSKDL